MESLPLALHSSLFLWATSSRTSLFSQSYKHCAIMRNRGTMVSSRKLVFGGSYSSHLSKPLTSSASHGLVLVCLSTGLLRSYSPVSSVSQIMPSIWQQSITWSRLMVRMPHLPPVEMALREASSLLLRLFMLAYLACLAVAVTISIYIFYHKGPQIRARSSLRSH